ncbi:MAG: hypothetical protein U7123_20860 [Potamolinea sp.]
MKLSCSSLNSLGNFLQLTTVTALFLSYPTILLPKTNQGISPNTVLTSVQFARLSGVVSKASILKIDRSLLAVDKSEEPQPTPPPVPEKPGGPRG